MLNLEGKNPIEILDCLKQMFVNYSKVCSTEPKRQSMLKAASHMLEAEICFEEGCDFVKVIKPVVK